MTSTNLFYIIIAIIIVDFLVDKILDALNAKQFNNPIPYEVSDVYNAEDYEKSQANLVL